VMHGEGKKGGKIQDINGRIHAPLILASVAVLLYSCGCRGPSIDPSLFTVEEFGGIRWVHNHGAQSGYNSDLKLELLGRIGKLDGIDDKDMLFDPVDAVRLPGGDILILEGRGCTVKRYDRSHEYLSSFGKSGQGPGDLMNPFAIRVEENRMYVAGRTVSVFTQDGVYVDGFRPPVIMRFGSIGAQYSTSGMAVLSGSRVVLPSHPSEWLDSRENRLLSVFDMDGGISRAFGAFKPYASPELTLNANIVYFTADRSDNVYIAYAHQNIVAKYSPEGEMVFSADRVLPYDIQNVIKVEVFKSGDMEREFPWPSVSSVSRGIHIDHKERIWVLTFLKQPDKFMSFGKGANPTECYEFDIFDSDGILLFKIPFPNVRFDNYSLCGDRIYLIDSSVDSCVYEYRIMG